MEGLTARVEPEAHSTSDHETISGLIQLSPSPRRHPMLKFPKFNGENAEVFRQALSATAPPNLSVEVPTPQLLDAVTASGIAALSACLLTANLPRPACVPCKDYWNQECSDQWRRYLEARRNGDQSLISEAHKNFRKSPPPPPILFQNVTYSTPTERADIFFRTKLARAISQPDVPRYTHTCPRRTIPTPLSIDEDEVRYCLLNVSSTTPGHAHLSVSALRLIWTVHTWRSWIVHLYNLCLTVGHHPSIFRRAEVVVIPKPHKDDLSNPANWRPISLLPVLGKGLERLLARRFAFWALSNRIISPMQFGALPGKSAVDLVECLVHDVEKAWESNQVCTLATIDIQSAFDSVQPGRLSVRLREQGWPLPYVNWAASFASRRKARLRVDDFVGDFLDIPHGLPQGSPASPILFLLFLEPLFKLGFPTFGYVDDVAILSVAKTLVDISLLTASRVGSVTRWCEQNGLSLADKKTEILHLHRSRQPPPLRL
ncbi:hypothetical protein K3495_g10131 [Podosphaera aphanis]|nr:hypothetical protein K3495_g10131 [Podosphaera aphanis]